MGVFYIQVVLSWIEYIRVDLNVGVILHILHKVKSLSYHSYCPITNDRKEVNLIKFYVIFQY